MRTHMSWLSEAESDLVVEQALMLLERVGMCMAGSQGLSALAESGARVDAASGVVCFPAQMVLDAVAHTPRRVVMAGSAPEFDVVLDEGEPSHFCSSGCAAFTLDADTNERRPSTLADLRDATALLDETPDVDLLWTTVTANDVPIDVRELVGYYTVLGASHKHVVFVDCPSQADPIERMIPILAGDEASFRARPRFSTLLTAASPLKADGVLLDFHSRVAAWGVPVKVYTVPMAGATSPVTLAGTITQGIAELLGVTAALQTFAPGSRLIWGPSPTTMDPFSGGISYGSPEAALMGVACVEVAHRLGVPASAPGMATDAKYAALQTGFEKGTKGLLTVAAEADILSGGVGLIDAANTLHLPQIVTDGEMARVIRRLLAGIEVSTDTIMADMVERVGIGGTFLKEKETTRRLRAGEHLRTRVFTRAGFDAWQAAGRDESAVAREVMAEMLAAHAEREPPLTPEQRRELAAVCEVTGDVERALRR
jgi:trimethylamine--corrinoid protein Co-methyltransferase